MPPLADSLRLIRVQMSFFEKFMIAEAEDREHDQTDGFIQCPPRVNLLLLPMLL